MSTDKQKKRSLALRCGAMVGGGPSPAKVLRLTRKWKAYAESLHTIGAAMYRHGNMAGKEYMQTAAAYRHCARDMRRLVELSKKRQPTPNCRDEGRAGNA
jgi:hypothetical protein